MKSFFKSQRLGGELAGDARNTLTFRLYRRPLDRYCGNHATFVVQVQHPHNRSVTSAGSRDPRTDLQDIFDTTGSLARALKGFVPRRQQLHMAQRVADALDERRMLVIEAGTGTGKTFGYLVPVLHVGPASAGVHRHPHPAGPAVRQGSAAARRGAGYAGDVAVLKGRGNYLCLHRLDRRSCSRPCAAADC